MSKSRLTGNEEWVIAGQQGETIWARKWGDADWWWPIIDVDLETALIRIDVCGMSETWDLCDCAQLRIGSGKIVDNEDIGILAFDPS